MECPGQIKTENMGRNALFKDWIMPIDVSNVAIFNPTTGKADRVGFRILDDGRKVRYFKSNGEVLDA